LGDDDEVRLQYLDGTEAPRPADDESAFQPQAQAEAPPLELTERPAPPPGKVALPAPPLEAPAAPAVVVDVGRAVGLAAVALATPASLLPEVWCRGRLKQLPLGTGTLLGGAAEICRPFERFMVDPIETDKTCRAKTAIVRTLLRLGHDDSRLFLVGVRHFQHEPAWGDPVETAAELRGLCALGLVRARHPEAALLVAERLADPHHVVRAAAARALAEVEPVTALPLLWFKVAVGDAEPEVVAACFASLLELAPAKSVALAAQYIGSKSGSFAEAVALALGESKRREAFEVLAAWSERASASRAVAFVALTLLRSDQAFDHLLDVVARGKIRAAEDAIRALAHFRHDVRLTTRVLEAVRSRQDPELLAAAETAFRAHG